MLPTGYIPTDQDRHNNIITTVNKITSLINVPENKTFYYSKHSEVTPDFRPKY